MTLKKKGQKMRGVNINKAKRVIQAIAMTMGRRPSIFGWLAGRSLGGMKTKSLFSILGNGFLAVGVEAREMPIETMHVIMLA
jgi:hypothetical protein